MGAFISLQFLFYNVPTIVFSCQDGEFKGFSKTNMPPACMACIPYCKGNISVFDSKGNFVCESYYEEYNDNVGIPCKPLKNIRGENITINYFIRGLNNSNFEGEVVKFYNG